MKNRYLYIALCAAGILSGATSCNDYLETKSPSTNDADFVFSNITTAQAALMAPSTKCMVRLVAISLVMACSMQPILLVLILCVILRLIQISLDVIL